MESESSCLMTRMTTLERRLDSLDTMLDMQQHAARQADGMRPLGVAFPGVNMTGISVELTIHNSFDSDGVFISPESRDDIVIVSHGQDLPDLHEIVVCERFPRVLAVGRHEVAMTLCDIKTATSTMVSISRYFQFSPPNKMQLFCIERELMPLALACVHQSGESQVWEALARTAQTRFMHFMCEGGGPCPSNFFARARHNFSL